MSSTVGLDPRWRVAPLSVVPQGEEYLVGDAGTGVFVLLPEIGVQVIDWLREGLSLEEITQLAGGSDDEHGDEDVDVRGFVDALADLGFAVVEGPEPGPVGVAAGDLHPSDAGSAARSLDAVARLAFGRVAWTAYAAAVAFVATAFAVDPALLPTSRDLFFLPTPALSLTALTLMIYVLAMAHEGAHWLAARAAGVRGRISISRRLYALTLETDLTGLWAVPRRRRIGPLLAGLTFDGVVLAAVLVLRLTTPWSPGLLTALTFVQLAAIGSQWCVFLRTDVYALLVAATGCVDLYRTTQLSLLSATRLATGAQRGALAAAPARDVRVARWYRWLWLVGMALAAWFLVAYVAPATAHTVAWVVTSLGRPGLAAWPFWEALGLGAVLLSPTALTVAVLLRDGLGWMRRMRRFRP